MTDDFTLEDFERACKLADEDFWIESTSRLAKANLDFTNALSKAIKTNDIRGELKTAIEGFLVANTEIKEWMVEKLKL